MPLVSVYFGLGSNQGNREENIRKALSRMDAVFGRHYVALSRLLETPAWGFDGDPFLNACVLYRLFRAGTPEQHALSILHSCKAIERELGRQEELLFTADGKRVYRNRSIDIDLLFYGTEHINTEELTVPHPLIVQRDFVKVPLREIGKPALRHAFPELFD